MPEECWNAPIWQVEVTVGCEVPPPPVVWCGGWNGGFGLNNEIFPESSSRECVRHVLQASFGISLVNVFFSWTSGHFCAYLDSIPELKPIRSIVYEIEKYLNTFFYVGPPGKHLYLSPPAPLHVEGAPGGSKTQKSMPLSASMQKFPLHCVFEAQITK